MIYSELMGKGFDQKSLLKDLRDLARDSEREADVSHMTVI